VGAGESWFTRRVVLPGYGIATSAIDHRKLMPCLIGAAIGAM
jgi:hypothetical protein